MSGFGVSPWQPHSNWRAEPDPKKCTVYTIFALFKLLEPATLYTRWLDKNSVLEGSGRRWLNKNSLLEGSRRRWLDENSVLEGSRRRWLDKNSVLEASGSRLLDKNCFGGPGKVSGFGVSPIRPHSNRRSQTPRSVQFIQYSDYLDY